MLCGCFQNSGTSRSHVKKVFVGGIKENIDEEELRNYFQQYGSVETVDVIRDRETQKKRGFAFVGFSDYDPVDKIVCESGFHCSVIARGIMTPYCIKFSCEILWHCNLVWFSAKFPIRVSFLSLHHSMWSSTGVEIKPNIPLAWGMSSPEKLLVPKKNH